MSNLRAEYVGQEAGQLAYGELVARDFLGPPNPLAWVVKGLSDEEANIAGGDPLMPAVR